MGTDIDGFIEVRSTYIDFTEPDDDEPDESGGLWVSVHDGPSSAVTVTVPLFSPPPGWVGEQHALLSRIREVYPREVVETSSGAYEWRRDRD